MKKVTKKAFGILALVVLAVPVQAGWLSNLGQRIVNGAANTVQTNISGKVNKAVNDVMDGKVQTQNNETKKSNSKAAKSGNVNSKTSEVTSEEYLDTKVTRTSERGKAIHYSNKYERIDLGTIKFTGERVYYNRLPVGTGKVDIDEFLDPGYYFIWIDSISRTYTMSVVYEHESEGIGFGYGIINKKKIFNNGPREMLGDKDGIGYIVEILPNTQGHLELTMVNNQNLNGSGIISIFKIPGPELK